MPVCRKVRRSIFPVFPRFATSPSGNILARFSKTGRESPLRENSPDFGPVFARVATVFQLRSSSQPSVSRPRWPNFADWFPPRNPRESQGNRKRSDRLTRVPHRWRRNWGAFAPFCAPVRQTRCGRIIDECTPATLNAVASLTKTL